MVVGVLGPPQSNLDRRTGDDGQFSNVCRRRFRLTTPPPNSRTLMAVRKFLLPPQSTLLFALPSLQDLLNTGEVGHDPLPERKNQTFGPGPWIWTG